MAQANFGIGVPISVEKIVGRHLLIIIALKVTNYKIITTKASNYLRAATYEIDPALK